MRRKRFLIIALFLAVCSLSDGYAQSRMTDEQVMEYVKTGVEQGKDQRLIATELARKGVTREQIERVKELYRQNAQEGKNGNGTLTEKSRLRDKNTETDLKTDTQKGKRQESECEPTDYGRGMADDGRGMEKRRTAH